jgi:hypothetical protein
MFPGGKSRGPNAIRGWTSQPCQNVLNDTPGVFPENAAEAASLDVIARFSLAQEQATLLLSDYLDSRLAFDVRKLLWRGGRFSDDERLEAVVALAKASGYPLHQGAYRGIYTSVKTVRNHLAHGGPPLVRWFENTNEPMLWAFSASKSSLEASVPHVYSLTTLLSAASDARWLNLVAWRIRALITGAKVPPAAQFPSDVPRSAVRDEPAEVGGWGAPISCPYGHESVRGARTAYGDAWLCEECDNVRMVDRSILLGSGPTL